MAAVCLFSHALSSPFLAWSVCHGAEEAKAEILDYLQEPGKMPLAKCINAPWIDGKCDGVPMGRMFCREHCRKCERHTPTRAESTINANMAAVDEYFKVFFSGFPAERSAMVFIIGTLKYSSTAAIDGILPLLRPGRRCPYNDGMGPG